jgi:hypothetical protein
MRALDAGARSGPPPRIEDDVDVQPGVSREPRDVTEAGLARGVAIEDDVALTHAAEPCLEALAVGLGQVRAARRAPALLEPEDHERVGPAVLVLAAHLPPVEARASLTGRGRPVDIGLRRARLE